MDSVANLVRNDKQSEPDDSDYENEEPTNEWCLFKLVCKNLSCKIIQVKRLFSRQSSLCLKLRQRSLCQSSLGKVRAWIFSVQFARKWALPTTYIWNIYLFNDVIGEFIPHYENTFDISLPRVAHQKIYIPRNTCIVLGSLHCYSVLFLCLL